MNSDGYTYDLGQRIAAIKAIAKRREDGLKLLRLVGPEIDPSYNDQLGFARCQAMEQMIVDANRTGKALRNDQNVLTPHGWTPIAELSEGDTVIGGDGSPCTVTGVFPQGIKQTFRVTFDDGASVVCCEDHLWKCKKGNRRFGKYRNRDEWEVHSLRTLRQHGGDFPRGWHRTMIPTVSPVQLSAWPVPLDPYTLGVLIGDGCIKYGVSVSSADEEIVTAVANSVGACRVAKRHSSSRSYDYSITTPPGRRNPVKDHLVDLGLFGKGSEEKFIPRCYLWNTREVRLAMLQGLLDTDGTICKKAGHVEFSTVSPQLAEDVRFLVMSLGGKCRVAWRSSNYTHKGIKKAGKPSARVHIRLPRVPLFRLARKAKWIRDPSRKTSDGRLLASVTPTGLAECTCISVDSQDNTFVTEDFIVTHNTLTAAAKVAAIARNVPLVGANGEKVDCRPPRHRDKALTIWIIGYQFNHIGQTMFRLLFEEGAFQIIQDEDTKAWRSYEPWREYDQKHKDLTFPAPPLIPSHEIDHDSWTWERKGAKEVASVRLKNGVQLHFFPSTAEVKKGDPVHLIWLDELIAYSEHYTEWIARLTDYEGLLIWSTMKYRQCEAIGTFLDAARDQQEDVERGERKPEDVFTKAFSFRADGNPYLSKERLAINREIYNRHGDDIAAQRLDGGDIFASVLIYPFFNRTVHCAIPRDEEHHDDLAKLLKRRNGLPPADWTHELAIDPGAQKPAVLFFATPPPVWIDEDGHEWSLWAGNKPYYVPYDEIYGRRYSLKELVREIKGKMRGIRFRRFIMDMQGGNISSMTGAPPAHRQFSIAFAEEGIESEETGVTFRSGGTHFQDRKRAVENWMEILPCGFPQLRIVNERCPNLVNQLERNTFETDANGNPTDMPKRRERNDLRDALEYIASRNPAYVRVEQIQSYTSQFEAAMKRRNEIFGQEPQSTRCHFGPGLAPGVA